MKREETDIAMVPREIGVDDEQKKQSGPALVSESGPAVRARSGQYPVNMDMGS
jgi:hypothetical protein